MKGQLSHSIEIGSDPSRNITRIGNAMEAMPKQLEEAAARLANVEQQLETAKVEVNKPFPQEQELADKLARLAELNSLLDMDEKSVEEIDTAEATEKSDEIKEERPSLVAKLHEKKELLAAMSSKIPDASKKLEACI